MGSVSQALAALVSEVVAEPTVAGWFKNYTDWLLPYMQSAAIYIGAAALVQLAVEAISKQPANPAAPTTCSQGASSRPEASDFVSP